MQKIKLDPNSPDPSAIKMAAKLIESGKVVICPTDTVYILATNGLLPKAVQKIFDIKGRDYNKPIHVNVSSFEMAEKLVNFNLRGKFLFEKFIPGPITIVLPKKPNVPSSLTGGLQTLGIRIPDNKITLAISKSCSVPYTTTSANPSGGKNPYSIDDILKNFDEESLKMVDLILESGILPENLPSTVVDVSTEETRVLRIGPISEAQVTETLKNI